MKKLLLIFFCLLVAPVYGQSSKTQLTTEINTNLPTNGANKISAAMLRTTLIDMVNSWLDLGGAASLLCPTNQYVTGFTSLSIPQCSSITPGSIPTAALTSNNDTNVTITLGGSPATALVNAASISLGWSGTLAASRLNSNVVQSVVNDTNVTGSITAQSLTLGWTGALGLSRGGLGGSQFAATANQVPVFPGGSGAAVPTSFSAWQPGAPANVLNTQTANYSIATTDCGKTIQAGTGSTGLFTVTLPAVTGFASTCVITVKNADTGRGKILSGFPSDLNSILWPLQTLQVGIVNGAWATMVNPGRWHIPTSEEVCVRQDGVTTTDGLGNGTVAADCFASQQTAASTIGQQWDGGGYNACSVGLYTGGTSTLAGGVTTTGQSIGCYLTFNVRGAVTITSTVSCYDTGDNGIIIFNANLGSTPVLKCNSSNTVNDYAFYLHQNGIFDINGVIQWIPAGTNDGFLFLDGQGRATVGFSGGGLTVGDGSAETFADLFHCDEHCSQIQTSGAVTFSANLTGTRVYAAYGGSLINADATFTGTFTGVTTSISSGNSVLITNGVSIPGGTTTAGTGGAGLVCTSKC